MPRPDSRKMPEIPPVTPWVPVVPEMPDLPDEIPWPPDFDFEYDLSPWYSGNDGRPYCYNDFASRLMRLIFAVALLREAAGLRSMYPPFDLRFMVATPTLVNIATLWLTVMWNTATIGGGTPDPSWTSLWDYTVEQSGYVQSTRTSGESQCNVRPVLNDYTDSSVFIGAYGWLKLTQTASHAVAGLASGGVLRGYSPNGMTYLYAQIDLSKWANGSWSVTFARAGGVSTIRTYAGAEIEVEYTFSGENVIYKVNGTTIFDEAARTVADAPSLGMRAVTSYAASSVAVGRWVRTTFSTRADMDNDTSDPKADAQWDEWTAYVDDGTTDWSVGAAAYSGTVHYLDGDGNPVGLSSPTPPIAPLSSTLECRLMQPWLGAVENVLWPHLRS